MNTQAIKLTTLSPVHIGSGHELKGNFEYLLFTGERLAVLIDDEKVFDIIGEENLSHWVSIVDKGENLLDYLQKRKKGLQPTDIARRILSINGKKPSAQNNIKEQLHGGSRGVPLIPGSSLKGAIRTAIFTQLVYDDPAPVKNKANLGRYRHGRFEYNDQKLMGKYFGQEYNKWRDTNEYSPNKDFMKLLRVGDGYFRKDQTEIRESLIINLDFGNWKVKDRNYLECIPQDLDTQFNIQVPQETVSAIRNRRYISDDNLEYLQLPTLLELINRHTLALVGAELDFIDEERNPEPFGDYFDLLSNLEEQLKAMPAGSCILRLGAGAGWDFMTGAWAKSTETLTDELWNDLKRQLRRKNYPQDLAFPKTRKLLSGGVPLGFIRLDIM